MPKLVICGSIAIDRIMNFSGRYQDLIKPDKIHVLSLSTLLDKMENTPGGVGANISYSSALLGESPILIGSAGEDATDYMQRLTDAGVDTSNVHTSKLATASFNVMTDTEGNQVGGFYPGAMSDSASLSLKPWQGTDVLVMVSAFDPSAMQRLVAQCQEFKLRLAYDPGQQVASLSASDLGAGIDTAEVVLLNDYETSMTADKLGISLSELKSRVQVLVTTLGKHGSVIEGKNVSQPIQVGIAKPAEVIDPTGAGDAYRAGFLYGYLRQWELAKCGQLGAVVASFIVEKHGTQTEFTRQAIAKRYKDTFNEEIEL